LSDILTAGLSAAVRTQQGKGTDMLRAGLVAIALAICACSGSSSNNTGNNNNGGVQPGNTDTTFTSGCTFTNSAIAGSQPCSVISWSYPTSQTNGAVWTFLLVSTDTASTAPSVIATFDLKAQPSTGTTYTFSNCVDTSSCGVSLFQSTNTTFTAWSAVNGTTPVGSMSLKLTGQDKVWEVTGAGTEYRPHGQLTASMKLNGTATGTDATLTANF
jgi:hypothetical protein